MTANVLTKYFLEARVSWPHSQGHTTVQFMDNASGHKVLHKTTLQLNRTCTELCHFPPNSTHLTQPCDFFVISKIKDAWMRRWEEKKLELLRVDDWQGVGNLGVALFVYTCECEVIYTLLIRFFFKIFKIPFIT